MLAAPTSILALSTQLPSGRSPGPHLPEQGQVFFFRPVPVRRRATRLAETAAIVLDLLVAQVVDVCLPLADELLGQLVHLVEIIGRVQGSIPKEKPSQLTSAMMESTYSTPSVRGLVSSKRRLQWPPYCSATPKLRQIALA